MTFLADLHIATQNSRTTAPRITFAQLFAAGYCKGIDVIGTGDCTNPRWLAEMRTQLHPSGDGLFRLRRACWPKLPQVAGGSKGIRFMISGVIKTVFQQDNLTRKVDNLLFFPGLDEAEIFAARLRPYFLDDDDNAVGLTARELLEMLLSISPHAVLIPAHIWHPRDSLFGAKRTFSSVEDCYHDLASHIFALETGLDADPAMNRRISMLDNYALLSNSEANSPEQLGRAANIFAGEAGYSAIFSALAGKTTGFRGTMEAFAEVGKNYADGHRKCQCSASPEESQQLQGHCPMCGRKMTCGIASRIAAMADRPEGKKVPGARRIARIIPLLTILAELQQLPEKSKPVAQNYQRLLAELAPENTILQSCPPAELRRVGGDLFAHAIEKMRAAEVSLSPGYGGEEGSVTIFTPEERAALLLQEKGRAFSLTSSDRDAGNGLPGQKNLFPEYQLNITQTELSEEQQQIVNYPRQALLVNAGAGCGKSHLIPERVVHLIKNEAQPASSVLVLSSCNRAANEMRHNLHSRLAESPGGPPLVLTFEQLALRIITEQQLLMKHSKVVRLLSAAETDELFLRTEYISNATASSIQEMHNSLQKSLSFYADSWPAELPDLLYEIRGEAQGYLQRKIFEGLLDALDVLLLPTVRLIKNEAVRDSYQQRWTNVLVDDYQYITQLQYLLLKLICPPTAAITAFGDAAQLNSAAQDGELAYMQRFAEDFPGAAELTLTRNYRSCHSIVKASTQLTAHTAPPMWSNIPGPARIAFTPLPSAEEEGEYVLHMLQSLLGGGRNATLESARADEKERLQLGYGDIAVLYRTPQAGEAVYRTLINAGIPCQCASCADAFQHPQQRQVLAFLHLANTPQSPVCAEDLLRAGLPGLNEDAQLRLLRRLHNMKPMKKPIVQRLNAKNSKASPLLRLKKSLEIMRNAHALTPVQSLHYAAKFFEITADELAAPHWQALFTLARQTRKVADLLATIAQLTDADLCASQSNHITLSTVAAARGCEWEVVLLLGCQAENDPLDIAAQEERRIFNLAITRARRYLFLSAIMPQEGTEKSISPILQEISHELLYTRQTRSKKRAAKYTQLKMDW